MVGATKCRFKIGHLSNSLADRRGQNAPPPNKMCDPEYCNGERVNGSRNLDRAWNSYPHYTVDKFSYRVRKLFTGLCSTMLVLQ